MALVALAISLALVVQGPDQGSGQRSEMRIEPVPPLEGDEALCAEREGFPRWHPVQTGDTISTLATNILKEYAQDYHFPNCLQERLDQYLETIRNFNALPEGDVIFEGDCLLLPEPTCGAIGGPQLPPMTGEAFQQVLDALLRALPDPFNPSLESWFLPFARKSAVDSVLKDLVDPTILGLTPPWRILMLEYASLLPASPSSPRGVAGVLHITAVDQTTCARQDERIVFQAEVASDKGSVEIISFRWHRNKSLYGDAAAEECT